MSKKAVVAIIAASVIVAVAGFFLVGNLGMGTSRAYTALNFEQTEYPTVWLLSFDKFNGYYERRITAPEDGLYVIYYEVVGDFENIQGSLRGETFNAVVTEAWTYVVIDEPLKKGDSVILRFDCTNAGPSEIFFSWGKEVEEHFESTADEE